MSVGVSVSVVGGLVRVCGAGLLPSECCWDIWPWEPVGHRSERPPDAFRSSGTEVAGKTAWGGGRGVPAWPGSSLSLRPFCWPPTHRVFLAPLPSSPPFMLKTHPSLSFKILFFDL